MMRRCDAAGAKQCFRPRSRGIDHDVVAETPVIQAQRTVSVDAVYPCADLDVNSGLSRAISGPEAERAIVHLRVEKGKAAEQFVGTEVGYELLQLGCSQPAMPPKVGLSR